MSDKKKSFKRIFLYAFGLIFFAILALAVFAFFCPCCFHEFEGVIYCYEGRLYMS